MIKRIYNRLKSWRPDPWTLVLAGLVVAAPAIVQLWRVRYQLTELTVESASIFYGLSALITVGLFLVTWGGIIVVELQLQALMKGES